MNDGKLRMVKILIGVFVGIVILIVGVTYLAQYIQSTQWISRTIDTQAMSDMRALSPDGKLVTKSIVSEKATVQKSTLYTAYLYPQARTIICTVDKPEAFESFAAYLVSDTGATFAGWYNPENMGDISSERYGIVKIMFENLTTNQIRELHLVDKSAVTIPYKPNDDIPKLIYTLTSPTNSEVESMTAASSSQTESSEASK